MVQSTESAIISSFPTSVSGIIVLLNIKRWLKISRILFSTDSSLWAILREKFSMIKLSISIFGKTTGYRNYTESREPIRLLEMPYPVFGIK